MLNPILSAYGISAENAQISKIGDGLINHTWKVQDEARTYILQQMNEQVFSDPAAIDHNLGKLQHYLQQHHPGYLFAAPLPSLKGQTLLQTENGFYRIFPFIAGSHTVNVLQQPALAFEAARQFGLFTANLQQFDIPSLQVTLSNFHNLSLRYKQFTQALEGAQPDRKLAAKDAVAYLLEQQSIVQTYEELTLNHILPLRVIHHDTKISNVLFDAEGKGLCVIDLDTVMPGYFISDVGDMMRTYLSAANEEELDLTKVTVRPEYFKAIYDGYMGQMKQVLNDTERGYFFYAGKFIIYMQALRFLTDYLENDRYYGRQYEAHNLNRALNQITLLQRYLETAPELQQLIG